MSQPYFEIDKFSHHFVLSKISPVGMNVVYEFTRAYQQWGLLRENGRFIRKIVKVFGTRNHNHSEYRFHIEQLPALMKLMADKQVHESCYVIHNHIPDLGREIDVAVKEGWKPRDYQEPIIAYLGNPEPSIRKLVEVQTGAGKAQPLDALIKVPHGWKYMRDIKVGDPVIAKDGTVTTVSGVFPQGMKPIFKVWFQDGRSTECCHEHLWKIHKTNCTHQSKVVDTLELMRLKALSNNRVYVDLIDPEDCADVELPLDPYILGLLLGDGCLGVNSIGISSADEFILNQIREALPEELGLRYNGGYDWRITNKAGRNAAKVKNHVQNKYLDILRLLGLTGTSSSTKFLPEMYWHGSIKQRTALLQGLMDTDGTVCHNGSSSFTSVSYQLACAVQYLVRSLGGLARMRCRIPTYSYLGEKKLGQLAYTVQIRHNRAPSDLFRLPRKKEMTNNNNQYANHGKMMVEEVTFVGYKEAQCISITHPEKLYVTDEFIPTHNTSMAMFDICNKKRRVLILVKPQFMLKWAGDVTEISNIQPSEVMQVSGSAALMALITMAKEGRLESKVIIISNKTMQNWISLYERVGDEGIELLGYDCRPQDLTTLLEIGVRLIDEVHMDFHLNFKLDLYTHVAWSTSLSATLVADDPFLTRMYELAYPKASRYAGLPYNKFINAYSWIYRFNRPDQIRTHEFGQTSYSHNAFEKSVLKKPLETKQYLEMIDTCVNQTFLKPYQYQKGDKLLVYCASINMCTAVSKYLGEKHKDLDVRRYVDDDPKTNLHQSDVVVSTIGSAGTGHDIKGLTTVVLTNALSSSQSNIQGSGRLREIPGRDVNFIYYVCSDIPKHLDYHEKKKTILKGIAKSYNVLHHGPLIGY